MGFGIAASVLTIVSLSSGLPLTGTMDGARMKRIINTNDAGDNLLDPGAWRPWQKGYERKGGVFVCDNASDTSAQRGVSQTVVLNQTRPEAIIATAWSRAKSVRGGRNGDYSLYIDIVYSDGTPLWGQVASFSVGTHNWEKAKVVVFPEKPIRSLSFHMLFRRHSGKVWFRDPELRIVRAPAGACLFDGVPVTLSGASREGFQIRDVAANSDFVRLDRQALGVKLTCNVGQSENGDVTYFDTKIYNSTGRDRAITLVYALPVSASNCRWLEDPRRSLNVEKGREYMNAGGFPVGANGRLSRYPFAAVVSAAHGVGLGIDMARPAFFRAGYNAETEELFLAYDIGLAPEKPSARLRFWKFTFEPRWGFRAALARYYEIFPEYFRCRTPEQGLWMPFARISDVNDWRDFGFKFKEGTNETAWDDRHGITTFRYTEPMTWWMSMPKDMPRTLESALTEARRLAEKRADPRARAFLTSGFHDQEGNFSARLRNTPWCDGAVWSINSMPNIKGDVTDFKNKWNPAQEEKLYGPNAKGRLDGEYVDSSEGYVTDELDFRRDHFPAAATPLTFSLDSRKVAIFRGLISFEYTRALAKDVHFMRRLMMANSTPSRLCWLAPQLDVMGTETDWNRSGKWQPMSDRDMLYRRSLCKGKPFCFLMNSRFEEFSHEHVEKYMKRSLAYGMFPGFFSHNASQGHYFTRPELYERDRPLFKKYVPLCKLVAEAGWEPITMARSSDNRVYVERFGDNLFTVFNNSPERRTVRIELEWDAPKSARDLVSGRNVEWPSRRASLSLDGEDVAVIRID